MNNSKIIGGYDRPNHNGAGNAEWKSSEILQFYTTVTGKS